MNEHQKDWHGGVRSGVRSIVIVGCGAAGAAAKRRLIHLAQQHRLVDSLEISVIEPRPAELDGTGLAWSAQSSRLLVNMPVHTVCTDPSRRADFGNRLGVTGDDHPTVLFPPRHAVGKLLHADCVGDDAMAASMGLKIRRVQASATVIERLGNRLRVLTDAGQGIAADAIIVAIGNVPSTEYSYLRGCPGYVDCGWEPEKWAGQVAPAARVILIGSSVTAIDAAVVLDEFGHRGSLSMLSRGGRLPGVRGKHDSTISLKSLDAERIRALAAMSPTGHLSFEQIRVLVMNEMLAAGVGAVDLKTVWTDAGLSHVNWMAVGLTSCNARSAYFGVLKALDEVIPDLWNAADNAARALFRKDYLSDYARIAWPMAPVNGQRIYDMLKMRRLAVHGGLTWVRHEGDEFVATLEDGKGATRDVHADVVVNATGIGGRLDQMDHPLVRDLMRKGLAYPDVRHGGALSDFTTGRLLTPSGAGGEPIWATAGALTRGTRLLTNVLSEAGTSGARAAEAVVAHLTQMSDIKVGSSIAA